MVAWLTEKNCEGETWRALATPLSVSSQLGRCRDAIIVQCWVWLVGIVWQLVWKTTWQMEWKVGNTLRCSLVLPDVWHESVELECGWSCVRVTGFNVEDFELGMTDTDDLNDFMSVSVAHMTVTNTWMNTHTELELPAVFVF